MLKSAAIHTLRFSSLTFFFRIRLLLIKQLFCDDLSFDDESLQGT